MSERAVAKATHAYLEQWNDLSKCWAAIEPATWQSESIITGWRVGDLVAHFALVAKTITDAATQPTYEPPLSLADYLAQYELASEDIDHRTREVGASTQTQALAIVARNGNQAAESLEALLESNDSVVAARRGPVRWSDFVTTRVIELVVHADDLERSLAPQNAVAAGSFHSRRAVQLTVRALCEVLAERAPGHSVEVRVPPFAAVQCVAGPRHTRGTPGAVVEMDSSTFLRLASGRLEWSSAVTSGQVRASGQRTELAEHFPLFR
ncbi:MAG TPA: sterol carrier family protein [Actinomycetes bacterium]|nr:sterol carrier family protein [Actinomycetes bacterium]